MVPYSCDALLPHPERAGSLKFRRFAKWFDPYKLDYAEAVELVAFLHLVPVHAARYVFEWGVGGVKAARSLVEADYLVEASIPLQEANSRLVGLEDGLSVLFWMQQGGWVRGPVPDVVSMAVKELRKQGLSLFEVADRLRITHEQAKTMARVRQHRFVGGLGPMFAR